MDNLFPICATIVVAGVTVGIAYYALNKNKENGVVNSKSKLLSVDVLINEQIVVDTLDAKIITDWFNENNKFSIDGIKKCVAYPTKKNLAGIGYETNDRINPKSNILLFFYNDTTAQTVSSKLVSFSEMNSGLKELLDKNDGIIVLE